MEYLSFGRLLERCRFYRLPELDQCTRALVLGDGDGRFCARLLRSVPGLRVHAVDVSAAMLDALHTRCAHSGMADRLTTAHADATAYRPEGAFDLFATHFFLDCLSTEDVRELAHRLRACAGPGALWVVSEFHVPERGRLRLPWRYAVRALYLAFRILTGLRTQRLPDWPGALAANGFHRVASTSFAAGLLRSELWQAGEIAPERI